ncbi:unnamed protein product [Victoria cruziana]
MGFQRLLLACFAPC